MLKLKPIALSILTAAVAPIAFSQEQTDSKVYLEADVLIDNRAQGELIAEGDVVARFEDRELRADRIVYNVDTKVVRASGNVRITDSDGSLRLADEIEVDDKLGDGVATDFVAQLPQDATMVARAVSRKANGTNTLDKAVYTACKVCEENNYTPVWSLRARRAEQNAETKMITYKDAVFEVKGVPILYLPYFAHPDPSTERRSGFLMPTPKLSSTLGFVYEQPYYWAISKSQDLTITPKLHTNVNPSLGLLYRKKFYSGEIEADMSFAYDYMFDSQGDRVLLNSNGVVIDDPDLYNGAMFPSETSLRSHIFANGKFEINENWEWGFGIAHASDDFYLRRYDIDNRKKASEVYNVTGSYLPSYAYAVRQTETAYLDAAMITVQSLKNGLNDSTLGRATPIAFAENYFDYGNYGVVTLRGSTLVLNRDDGDDTRRFTTMADWQNSYLAPGGFVFEPEVRIRADHYDYSFEATDTTPQVDNAQSRASALAGATLRWPLINRKKNYDITLEPIITAAWAESSLENGVLPNEDSQTFEYTLAVAFESDPFTNYDLIETGGRIAAGVKSEIDFRNGLRADAAIARRWREEADPAFQVASNLSGKSSDYLISAGVEFGKNLRFDSDFRVDKDFNVKRTELTGAYENDRLNLRATYFDVSSDIAYLDIGSEGIEGISVKGNVYVTDSIMLGFGQLRDIERDVNLEQTIGISFYDECGFFGISYTKQNPILEGYDSSDVIKFTFGLKTLGKVTDDAFE